MHDLYQELIIDHGKRPRNFREMNTPTCSKEGHNPLCGDRLHLYVEHDGVIIKDVSFQGDGCAISMASASLLTQVLKGKSLIQADEIFQAFHSALINGEAAEPVDLGKLAALLGVSQYPTRVKCATLAWHTYMAAINSSDEPVSTE